MSNVYTWSTTAASNNSAAPNGAPEGMAPSAVNNVIRENMKTIADWRDFLGGAKTTVGTDTITLTSGLTITAYAAGQMFVAKLGGTNTGAATINIDSVGAVAVEINGAAVAANDLTSGKYVLFIYDGTAFQATKLSAADFSTAASETVSGIVELATTTEAAAGTDTARAVTAAGVAAAIAAQVTSGATAAEKSNIMLNSFRIEEQGGLTVQGMVDGVSDVFTDESGVDTGTSTDETYNAAGDYYENPGSSTTAASSAAYTAGAASVTWSGDDLTVNSVDDATYKTATNSVTNWPMQYGYTLSAAADNANAASGLFDSAEVGTFNHTSSNSGGLVSMTKSWYLRHDNGTVSYGASSVGTLSGGGVVNTDTVEWNIAADGTVSIKVNGSTEYTFASKANGISVHFMHASSNGNAMANLYWTLTTTPVNSVIVSNTFTALSQPDTAFTTIWHEDVNACTPNTDFTVEASRDAGTTWTAGTLALAATLGAAEILTCSIDISGQPAGTSMRWRFKFLNTLSQRLRGVGLQWS